MGIRFIDKNTMSNIANAIRDRYHWGNDKLIRGADMPYLINKMDQDMVADEEFQGGVFVPYAANPTNLSNAYPNLTGTFWPVAGDKVTDMSYAFVNCKTINPDRMVIGSNVENIEGLYSGYDFYQSLNMSFVFNMPDIPSTVTTVSNMFKNSLNMEYPIRKAFKWLANAQNVKYANGVFKDYLFDKVSVGGSSRYFRKDSYAYNQYYGTTIRKTGGLPSRDYYDLFRNSKFINNVKDLSDFGFCPFLYPTGIGSTFQPEPTMYLGGTKTNNLTNYLSGLSIPMRLDLNDLTFIIRSTETSLKCKGCFNGLSRGCGTNIHLAIDWSSITNLNALLYLKSCWDSNYRDFISYLGPIYEGTSTSSTVVTNMPGNNSDIGELLNNQSHKIAFILNEQMLMQLSTPTNLRRFFSPWPCHFYYAMLRMDGYYYYDNVSVFKLQDNISSIIKINNCFLTGRHGDNNSSVLCGPFYTNNSVLFNATDMVSNGLVISPYANMPSNMFMNIENLIIPGTNDGIVFRDPYTTGVIDDTIKMYPYKVFREWFHVSSYNGYYHPVTTRSIRTDLSTITNRYLSMGATMTTNFNVRFPYKISFGTWTINEEMNNISLSTRDIAQKGVVFNYDNRSIIRTLYNGYEPISWKIWIYDTYELNNRYSYNSAFNDCYNLTEMVYVNQFNNNTTDCFRNCRNAVGNNYRVIWDTGISSIQANNMFANCLNLSGSLLIKLPDNYNSTAYFNNMFKGCKNLDGYVTFDLGATSSLLYGYNMFEDCNQIKGVWLHNYTEEIAQFYSFRLNNVNIISSSALFLSDDIDLKEYARQQVIGIPYGSMPQNYTETIESIIDSNDYIVFNNMLNDTRFINIVCSNVYKEYRLSSDLSNYIVRFYEARSYN